MPEATVVIVAYRPKAGRLPELLALTREHLPILRAEGLATARESIVCQAADGTVIEVFEWEPGAMALAHSNAAVQAMWARFAEVCEYVPLGVLPETEQMFANFAPLT